MAYCKKCGAYIPDGLSACLACGYDDAAANAAAEAARKQSARAAQQAQPKTEQGETIEDIMARHRRLQQEKPALAQALLMHIEGHRALMSPNTTQS